LGIFGIKTVRKMPTVSYPAALFHGKCPRCREGQMFKYRVFENLPTFMQMNEACPHCGVRLESEPGFYQGAMYVGYAITVACIVAVSIILYFFAGHPSEWVYIGCVVAIMILIIPYNYRYSRILYLHFFGGLVYNPELSKKSIS
jgi:uncharacterized protein (DUF983 family)